MERHLSLGRLTELWRYYQAGIVNAAFSFALYALLVRLGLNMFWAQFVGTLIGIGFNYFTYSRHVFREAAPAKMRFVMAYGLNYLVSITALAGMSYFTRSPYLAGLGALMIASVINYVALKRLVFRTPVPE